MRLNPRAVVTCSSEALVIGGSEAGLRMFRELLCYFPAAHLSVAFIVRTPSEVITQVIA